MVISKVVPYSITSVGTELIPVSWQSARSHKLYNYTKTILHYAVWLCQR